MKKLSGMKRFAIKVLLFLVIFIAINYIVRLIYYIPDAKLDSDPRYLSYRQAKEFKNSEQQFDMIFMGSSHCYHSFNPFIVDSILGIQSYNMGTPYQKPLESYYMLKDILQQQNPKYLVYTVFWRAVDESIDYRHALGTRRLMESKSVKNDFLFNGLGIEGVAAHLFPIYKYHIEFQTDLKNFLKELLSEESSKNIDKELLTLKKGYRESSQVADISVLKSHFKKYRFQSIELNKKQMKMIRELIRLCKEANITPVFVSIPLAPSVMEEITNYDEIHAVFAELFEEEGVIYMDYNKNLPNPGVEDEDFKDFYHTNKYGATKISEAFARDFKALIYTGDIK